MTAEATAVGVITALAVILLCIGGAMYVATLIVRTGRRRMPQPGEVWSKKSGGDPWAQPFTVTVLDIRDGWVRYRMLSSVYSLPLTTFHTCYEPTEVVEDVTPKRKEISE